MKKSNYAYVFLLMLIVGIVWFISSNKNTDTKSSDEITVALVPHNGITINSKNPITIKKGESASFDITINDGYFFRESDEYTFSDSTLTFANVTEEKNLYFSPGKFCDISVEKSDNGKLVVTSDKVVAEGKTASVSISAKEHFAIDYVLVNNKKYPAPADGDFTFTVEDDSVISAIFTGEPVNFMAMSNSLGEVKINNDTSDFHYNDVIDLSTSYDDDSILFNGWSTDGYLDDGGTLLSSDTAYKFNITADTILYANFKDKHTYNISFDVNGGYVSASIDMHDLSPFVNVNLPVDKAEFSRDGYTLTGFNTKADGTGTHYSLGALYTMVREDVTLYADWTKWTDASQLSYSNTGTITINGLANTANTDVTTLCIPKYIDGVQVTGIGANAFNGNTNITEVVLPIGMTTVTSGAFSGCTNLKKVYLPETLTGLASDAFSNTPSFTTLGILASLDRAFDYDYDSAMAEKYMRLKNTTGKRIIVVGGSSVAFGLDSNMLKNKYPDYEIVNLGNSFLYGIEPLFDILCANTHEGDIVIFASEYYPIMYANEQAISIANWQYLESNYDILNDINIKSNPMILEKYMSYLERKKSYLPGKLKNSDSVYVRSGFNQYGDLTVVRTNRGVFQPEIPSEYLVNDLGMSKYNEACKKLTDNKVTCLFSFPPVSNGGASKEYIATQTESFMNALANKLDSNYITIISSVADNSYESSLFYDNFYHLTLDGAKVRTSQLIADLDKWGGIK